MIGLSRTRLLSDRASHNYHNLIGAVGFHPSAHAQADCEHHWEPEIKLMALGDPDLEPLWREIGHV